MKIAQILPELNAGGVERGTLEVAKYLVDQNHQSIVISNGGRLVPRLEAEGSRHIRFPLHRKSLVSLARVRPFRALIEKEQPDIIHLRSRVPAWIAFLAWRKMDPATRPRLVTTVHGFYSVNMYSQIMTRGERVIAVSEAARDYILENYPRTDRERIIVIPRGVPEADIVPGYSPSADWLRDLEAAQPQLKGKRVLLFPGRITRLKGHADFFQLVAGLKADGIPVHGLVVGNTHPKKRAYLQELRSQVETLGLSDAVTFIGHRNDLREMMAVSDAVLNLSQQPESFGRTTLEALAIGKPVIAYSHGGIEEQLKQLFPAGAVPFADTKALGKAVRDILLGNERPKPVAAPFTREAMCRATLDVYAQLKAEP